VTRNLVACVRVCVCVCGQTVSSSPSLPPLSQSVNSLDLMAFPDMKQVRCCGGSVASSC
jgi:hypothetical protein